MMKLILLVLTLLFTVDVCYSTCTGSACEAISEGNKGIVIRADDGDYFIPQIDTVNYNCSNHSALCFGENCRMCKCKTQQDTWKDSHGACKNINDGFYMFARDDLEVDTKISTVYFVLNSNGKYELQSVAAGAQLHIVKASTGDNLPSNCAVYELNVMTQDGLVEIEKDGFAIVNGDDNKRYLEISPGSLKIQPNHLQGKLIYMRLKCGSSKKKMYFKIQGKTEALINNTCFTCEGNFKYLGYLDIPEFPRPTTSDTPIHYAVNTLQKSGTDVTGCNGDSSNLYYYQNSSNTCSMQPLPNTNLIYATQNKVQGRNLEPTDLINSAHWDNMVNEVINMTVTCQGNKRFCVLFRLTNTTSNCSFGNPCRNGGMWVDKGIGSCACSCPDGYTGDLCTVVTDPCASSPCHEDATCTIDGSSYQCTCPAGKTGLTCHDNIDYCAGSPCCGDATCSNNGNTYQCTCPAGKTGSTCCDDIDYCAGSPCCGNATCSNNGNSYQCTCPAGKTGSTCCEDIDYCAGSPCCGDATCRSDNELLTYECTCPAGKTGLACCEDFDYCASSPCCGDATCRSDNELLTYECTCPAGKTGSTCCEDINYCDPNPCCNGARCEVDESYTVKCSVCPKGYTGERCCEEITTNDDDDNDDNDDDDDDDDNDDNNRCRDDTCSNGGTCALVEGATVCYCPSAYTGRFCQTLIRIPLPTGAAAVNENDNSNSIVPIAVIATASVILTAAVFIIAIIVYQRVYVPWRNRTRLARVNAVNPFKDSSAHQIYNPMYVDEDAAIYSDKTLPDSVRCNTSKSSHADESPDIKHIDNPLYTTENTTAEDNEHIYETSMSFPPLPPPPPQIDDDDTTNPFNPYDTLPESIGPEMFSAYDKLETSQIVNDPVYEAINGSKADV